MHKPTGEFQPSAPRDNPKRLLAPHHPHPTPTPTGKLVPRLPQQAKPREPAPCQAMGGGGGRRRLPRARLDHPGGPCPFPGLPEASLLRSRSRDWAQALPGKESGAASRQRWELHPSLQAPGKSKATPSRGSGAWPRGHLCSDAAAKAPKGLGKGWDKHSPAERQVRWEKRRKETAIKRRNGAEEPEGLRNCMRSRVRQRKSPWRGGSMALPRDRDPSRQGRFEPHG